MSYGTVARVEEPPEAFLSVLCQDGVVRFDGDVLAIVVSDHHPEYGKPNGLQHEARLQRSLAVGLDACRDDVLALVVLIPGVLHHAAVGRHDVPFSASQRNGVDGSEASNQLLEAGLARVLLKGRDLRVVRGFDGFAHELAANAAQGFGHAEGYGELFLGDRFVDDSGTVLPLDGPSLYRLDL